MKQLQLISIFILALCASMIVSTPSAARVGWVPENGYWEVITTMNQPKITTVRFFDLDRHLVYEEKVTGMVLDLHKRSVCRRLNRSLQTALAAWGKNKQLKKDRGIVAMNMRR